MNEVRKFGPGRPPPQRLPKPHTALVKAAHATPDEKTVGYLNAAENALFIANRIAKSPRVAKRIAALQEKVRELKESLGDERP